jgi:two-component system, OmpR family, sensor kinase
MKGLPLRTRVTVGFAAAMACVLAALGLFLYLRVGQDLLNGIDMELRSRGQVIVGALRSSHPGVVRSEGELIDPDEAFAQILAPNGEIVDSGSAVAGAPMVPPADLRGLSGPSFLTARVHGVDDPARLLVIPARGGDRFFVVVGATLGDRNEALARLTLALAISGPIALALVSWAGWALTGAALRPVENMRREAAAISLSEPDRRLPVRSTADEISRLGTTLNSMLDRLQASFEGERDFLDRASHELRTPLTVLRMELDVALARARSPEELRAALQVASAETDRLVRLAEDLLVLGRARSGKLALHRRDTAITELLERAAAAHRSRAEAAGVAIDVELAADLNAHVDPERIRQAVDDLMDNALRHCPAGGTIVLGAERANGRLHVAVSDSGPGFPSEVLEHGADLPPPTASASPNGLGLGLALVRAIATAHGGLLVLDNAPGAGARATLDLPD